MLIDSIRSLVVRYLAVALLILNVLLATVYNAYIAGVKKRVLNFYRNRGAAPPRTPTATS